MKEMYRVVPGTPPPASSKVNVLYNCSTMSKSENWQWDIAHRAHSGPISYAHTHLSQLCMETHVKPLPV